MAKHGGNLKELAEASGLHPDTLVDFSANINPLGPPPYFRAVISRALSSIVHYPDPDYTTLVEKVANRYKLDAERVVVGNGTSEIIFTLPRVLPVTRALIPVPSYVDYESAAQIAGLAVETVLLKEDDCFRLDWKAIGDRLKGGEMVFLGQPNNPTGQLFDVEPLLALAHTFPKSYFVVDEAFADFVEGYEGLFAINDLPFNVIVIKSLTKFYAIPGLRLGLASAAPEIAAKIQDSLPPWSVNALALALGEKMIEDYDYASHSRELVDGLRRRFSKSLDALDGIEVVGGKANYLLLRLSAPLGNAQTLKEKLLPRGYAIRVCDNFKGLSPQYIRLAVRNESENNGLIDALKSILTGNSLKPPRHKTASLMFQGAGSDAGKSILTAGLCRILLQDGVRVAPFKAQNMSLNSFVTRDGGEMGRAQVVQAQACLLDPETRMNPVLLKPSSDVGSQVIVNGKPVGNMTVEQYVSYKPEAFKAAQKAYDSLAAEYDAVILEGAGSPAEVNLKSHDIVNMNMARYAESPVLLIGDIDRGGIFASFVGTMEVLSEWERDLVAGFVVNRFRGRESLLEDAFTYTYNHTGKPVYGVIPFLKDLGLPEEDSVSFKKGLFERARPAGKHVEIALVDLPHISNFTDFEPFLVEPDVALKIIRHPDDIDNPDALILPGSKNVIRDLQFLKTSGLAEKIKMISSRKELEIVGICGGFQMLGKRIADPYKIEASGEIDGLALLDLVTTLEKEKTLTRVSSCHIDSGTQVYGYEIHHGQTPHNSKAVLRQENGDEGGAAASEGMVWGTYLHGIFDSDPFRHWFVEKLRQRKGLPALAEARPLYDIEPALDRLAGIMRERMDMKKVYSLLGL